MKRMMGLLLALAMALCACGAWAEALPFKISWIDESEMDEPKMYPSPHSEDGDYYYNQYDKTLTIYSTGLKVSDWGERGQQGKRLH